MTAPVAFVKVAPVQVDMVSTPSVEATSSALELLELDDVSGFEEVSHSKGKKTAKDTPHVVPSKRQPLPPPRGVPSRPPQSAAGSEVCLSCYFLRCCLQQLAQNTVDILLFLSLMVPALVFT